MIRDQPFDILALLQSDAPDPTMFDPDNSGIPDFQVQLVPRHTEVLKNGIIWARYSVKEL